MKGIVVTVYDMVYEYMHGEVHPVKRRCVEQADVVICISASVREAVCSTFGTPPGQVRTVPLACSSAFRPLARAERGCFGRLTDRPFLLYLGLREHDYKNFGRLLQAYGAWSHRSEVDLVVVGKPWTLPEQSQLELMRIDSRTHLVTGATDGRLCCLYNEALALVYPSRCEGFGLPVLEAMACECQVVASRIPTTEEIAGDYPVYFEPSSTESLIGALDRALLHPVEPSRRQQARRHATRAYSWSRTAASTLDAYQAL
jgi:glycosyltransferase involved in cell wall biosynthesis